MGVVTLLKGVGVFGLGVMIYDLINTGSVDGTVSAVNTTVSTTKNFANAAKVAGVAAGGAAAAVQNDGGKNAAKMSTKGASAEHCSGNNKNEYAAGAEAISQEKLGLEGVFENDERRPVLVSTNGHIAATASRRSVIDAVDYLKASERVANKERFANKTPIVSAPAAAAAIAQ